MSTEQHRVPIWGLFLALLALTAAEVALFEIWSRHQEIMPKFAMVLLLLIFTLPKAVIVLVYFMHLKFERHLVITIAIVPFIMVFIAVLPILTDTVTLKPQAHNQVDGLREFIPSAGHHDRNNDTHRNEAVYENGH